MRFVVALMVLVLPALVLAGQQKYDVAVDGMTCGSCASKVKDALSNIPGADKVQVVLKKKTASFVVAEDRPELKTEIAKAIADAGFTVTKINGKDVAAAPAAPATADAPAEKKD